MRTPNWPTLAAATIAGLAIVALAAVIAAAGFAISHYTSEPDPNGNATPAYFQGPIEAIVDLTETGKERWGSALEGDCNPDKLYVLALADRPDGVDVVSMPGFCNSARMLITPEDGAVRPEDPLFSPDSSRIEDVGPDR